MDDMLSTAILLAIHGNVPVVRREPTSEELEDPNVIVYDIGRRHEPAKSNFDHHQFPPDVSLCALSLILDHQGLLQKAREYWSWLEFVEVLDSRGPKGVEELLGVDFNRQVAPTASPVDEWLLEEWEDQQTLRPANPVHSLLRKLGDSLIQSLVRMEQRITELKDTTQWSKLDGAEPPITVARIMIPRSQKPASYLDFYWKKLGGEPLVSISEDSRGNGLALFSHDVARVDFRQIKNNPEITFVTNSGYFAVTRNMLDDTAVNQFIMDSLVSPDNQHHEWIISIKNHLGWQDLIHTGHMPRAEAERRAADALHYYEGSQQWRIRRK